MSDSNPHHPPPNGIATMRTCVGCGRKAPQSELLRYAAVDGVLTPDPARRVPGRGAYTCRRPACFERAASRRAFARTLRRTVTIPAGLNPPDERR